MPTLRGGRQAGTQKCLGRAPPPLRVSKMKPGEVMVMVMVMMMMVVVVAVVTLNKGMTKQGTLKVALSLTLPPVDTTLSYI